MCSLLVVYQRLYPAAVNRQLDVKERQLQLTYGKCELESWMKIIYLPLQPTHLFSRDFIGYFTSRGANSQDGYHAVVITQ